MLFGQGLFRCPWFANPLRFEAFHAYVHDFRGLSLFFCTKMPKNRWTLHIFVYLPSTNLDRLVFCRIVMLNSCLSYVFKFSSVNRHIYFSEKCWSVSINPFTRGVRKYLFLLIKGTELEVLGIWWATMISKIDIASRVLTPRSTFPVLSPPLEDGVKKPNVAISAMIMMGMTKLTM